MLMEADESQDLSSASWRTWRASNIIPVWRSAVSRPRENWFSAGVWRQDINWCPSSRHSGRRNFPLFGEGLGFLFYPGLQLIRWGPRPTHTLGRAICFTQFTKSTVQLIQNHRQRNTHNNIWPNNIWDARAQSSRHIKLTILLLCKCKFVVIIMIRNAIYFLSSALLLFNILMKFKSHILLSIKFI